MYMYVYIARTMNINNCTHYTHVALNSVGINECNMTNGGCDHICHDTKYSHYCSCNEGYHLNTTDLRSCIGKDWKL